MYHDILFLYGTFMKYHGILPSEIDKQNMDDFFGAINAKESGTTMFIDQINGW